MPFTPQRKLKPDLYRDQSFLSLSIPCRYMLSGLLQYVDQHGREAASLATLREAFFEFDDDLPADAVESLLLELDESGWLRIYTSGRRTLLQLDPQRFRDFVSVDARNPSRFPPPEPRPATPLGGLRAPAGSPAAEGRGEGAWAGSEAGDAAPFDYNAWMRDPDMPPPPGCPAHPDNTFHSKCGPCKATREIHEKVMDGRMTHAEAVALHRASAASADRPPPDEEEF